jgi:thiosulfate/3-mercaptopyruvate sulfurtransferase
MKHFALGVFVSLLGASLAGCDRSAARSQAKENPRPVAAARSEGPLAHTAWLHAHLSDPHLLVLDARSPQAYAARHIPGAVNVPAGQTFASTADPSRNLAPLDKIQKLLGDAGVAFDRPVIVYDDGADYRAAARVFFVLEVHGHRGAAVLDGGLAGWTAAGLPLSTESARPTPVQFVADLQPQLLVTKLMIARAVKDGSATLLDARTPEEYCGLKSAASRSGHIPTAINVAANDNLHAGTNVCQLKFSDELVKLYSKIPTDRKVIAYCNTGNRASVSYLALRVLGRQVAVYDGAWMEWGNDAALPIEVGVAAQSRVEQ